MNVCLKNDNEKTKLIYVITRHNIKNYGSILQALATQIFFERMNYNVKIINYVNKKEMFPHKLKYVLKNSAKFNKNIFTVLAFYLVKFPTTFFNELVFKKYRKILNLTSLYTTSEELKKLDLTNAILCSGSDQLWGPIIDENVDLNYYLAFSSSLKKIAFSSSVGRNFTLTAEIKNLLNQYSFISTREKSLSNQINLELPNKAFEIFDPTMMIEPEYWLQKCTKNKYKYQYILIYKLHENPLFEKCIKALKKQTGLKIIRISYNLGDIMLNGKVLVNKSPYRFLSLIKNASYIFTDSFHCSVFSLIFKKKFIVLSPGTTSIRINDLLTTFDLTNHIINDINNLNYINEEIDYEKVHKCMKKLRNQYSNVIKEKMRNIL